MLLALSCYGYAAIRPYIPALLIGTLIVTFPAWLSRLRQKGGVRGIACLATGFAIPFGVLVFKHLADPQMNIRASQTWVWKDATTLGGKISAVIIHYFSHFAPGFLFIHGAADLSQMPPAGFGMFHWYELALMLFGLVAVLATLRSSYASRILLVAVLAYPIGDTLSGYVTEPQALRSMVGMWALVLLSAEGYSGWKWLGQKRPRLVPTVVTVFAAWVFVSVAIFLYCFFGSYNRNQGVYLARTVGIQEVCQWLKPRLKPDDLVFWSPQNIPSFTPPSWCICNTTPRSGSPRRWSACPAPTRTTLAAWSPKPAICISCTFTITLRLRLTNSAVAKSASTLISSFTRGNLLIFLPPHAGQGNLRRHRSQWRSRFLCFGNHKPVNPLTTTCKKPPPTI